MSINKFCIYCCFLVIFISCSSTKRTTNPISSNTNNTSLSYFNSIKILGNVTLFYFQSQGKPSIEINSKDAADIIANVNNKELSIIRVGSGGKAKDILIKVNGPAIHNLDVTGESAIQTGNIHTSSSINIDMNGNGQINCGKIKGKNIRISMVRNGNIKVEEAISQQLHVVTADEGNITINGISTAETHIKQVGNNAIELRGTSKSSVFLCFSDGKLNAQNLKSERLDAELAGKGFINCHATRTLNAKVTGEGIIRYKGTPTLINNSFDKKRVKKF